MNNITLIRGEKHLIVEALLRQLANYPYHIGEIIYIAKMLKNEDWETLSIARRKSRKITDQLFRSREAQEISQNSSPVCYAKSNEVRDEYKIN